MEDTQQLKGFTEGFEGYYRSTPEARRDALRRGTIVFDTNALLDLYRFSPEARRELLDVIRAVRDRVFVPHQVALEFHRQRVDAVASRTKEFDAQESRLAEVRAQALGLVNQLARRAHGRDGDAEQVSALLEDAFDQASTFLDQVRDAYDLDPDRLAASPPDQIVTELSALLEQNVGLKPSDATLAADRQEALRRAEARIPPGYRDQRKPDGAEGDYLWWAEVLRHAAVTRPGSVVIVSNDVAKGDWVHESRGLRVGPAPVLVAEMSSAASAGLHWATTSEFLREVADALGDLDVSEGTLQEASSSSSLQAVVDAVRAFIEEADRPLASSAVANVALRLDPSLTETAWAGAGTFRSFVGEHLPEFRFVFPPSPGYVLDPERHSDSDIGPSAPPRDRQTAGTGHRPRVHELAKELGLSNRQTLELAENLGIGVRTHSSPLEVEEANRLRRIAQQDALGRD